MNTYPLLSDGRNISVITVFSLHVLSFEWEEVPLCYSCSRESVPLNRADRPSPTSRT